MSRARCAAAVTAALLAVGGAPARAAGGPPVAVNVQFAEFGPSQLDVLPGETVEWTNVSERDHTVTSDAGAFASDDLLSGDRFSVRFDDPGAFPYHCTIHAGMIGEVDARGVILGCAAVAVAMAQARGARRSAGPHRADRPGRMEDGCPPCATSSTSTPSTRATAAARCCAT
jgi:plastocyanin